MSDRKLTNTKTPNPSNPSSLQPRYEIRILGPEHAEWATAIVAHSNGFNSPVWPLLYPEDLAKTMHEVNERAGYLINHQIDSGLSYGVFDTEYVFKRPSSAATGGKLYWDASEPSVQHTEGAAAEAQRLLEQMDFPLVSVALSYDAANPVDMKKLEPLLAVLPHFGSVYSILAANDKRDPNSWMAQGPGEVLARNATATRGDYEGKGIMGGMARWLMREAALKGFRGIQIECLSDAVTKVWSTAEPPFRGAVVSEFDTGTWRDEEGKLVFEPVQIRVTKCWVDLKPEA
jgi:hypothetical protein